MGADESRPAGPDAAPDPAGASEGGAGGVDARAQDNTLVTVSAGGGGKVRQDDDLQAVLNLKEARPPARPRARTLGAVPRAVRRWEAQAQ